MDKRKWYYSLQILYTAALTFDDDKIATATTTTATRHAREFSFIHLLLFFFYFFAKHNFISSTTPYTLCTTILLHSNIIMYPNIITCMNIPKDVHMQSLYHHAHFYGCVCSNFKYTYGGTGKFYIYIINVIILIVPENMLT